jgi:hypothetical protein
MNLPNSITMIRSTTAKGGLFERATPPTISGSNEKAFRRDSLTGAVAYRYVMLMALIALA